MLYSFFCELAPRKMAYPTAPTARMPARPAGDSVCAAQRSLPIRDHFSYYATCAPGRGNTTAGSTPVHVALTDGSIPRPYFKTLH